MIKESLSTQAPAPVVSGNTAKLDAVNVTNTPPSQAQIGDILTSGSDQIDVKNRIVFQLPNDVFVILPAGASQQTIEMVSKFNLELTKAGKEKTPEELIASKFTKEIRKGNDRLESAADGGCGKSAFILGCLYYSPSEDQRKVINASHTEAYKRFDEAIAKGYLDAPIELFREYISKDSIDDKLLNWIWKNRDVNSGSREFSSDLFEMANVLKDTKYRSAAWKLIAQAAKLDNEDAKSAVESLFSLLHADVMRFTTNGKNSYQYYKYGEYHDSNEMTLLCEFAATFEHAKAYYEVGKLHGNESFCWHRKDKQKIALEKAEEWCFAQADELLGKPSGQAYYELAELFHNKNPDFDMKSKAYEYYVKADKAGSVEAKARIEEYKRVQAEKDKPLSFKLSDWMPFGNSGNPEDLLKIQ